MRRIRRSRVPSRDSTPDHGVLLEKFTDGRRRPALRRGHRGQMDPAVMLPTLERLMEIDRQAELAVSATTIDGDARNRGDATAETLDASGPQEGR